MFENGKRIVYITGLSLYNRLGLTTQVPKTIKIACRDKRILASLGSVKGKAVKSYVDAADDNYYLLELLDALKDFNRIPDLDVNSVIRLLGNKLNGLTDKERDKIIKYALKYPSRIRTLLGAILEIFVKGKDTILLKSNLNPLSEYQYKIPESVLPNIHDWKLKF